MVLILCIQTIIFRIQVKEYADQRAEIVKRKMVKKVAGQEERLGREEEEEVKKYNQEEKELSLLETDCDLFLSLNIQTLLANTLQLSRYVEILFFVQIYEVTSFNTILTTQNV